MLHLFFAVAFAAVPLTLYVPPVRSLNLFIATMEDLFRESRVPWKSHGFTRYCSVYGTRQTLVGKRFAQFEEERG
ncbi:hypothetical protein RJ640_015778 [Escallonia rubra]|uniref:Uncharacterized protein n=1 Tax=Escallonia rubra TaxID=112253 RepID=A0AA88RRN4_9ASTE|nr:hypothetical protein RJ640_015778 [Escallonia rubra]